MNINSRKKSNPTLRDKFSPIYEQCCSLLQKKCWMLLPWLVMSGLAVVLGVVGGILCVVLLPSSSGYKWVSLPVFAFTVFLLFPSWFASLHVFCHLCSKSSYQYSSRKQDYLFKYLYAWNKLLRHENVLIYIFMIDIFQLNSSSYIDCNNWWWNVW